MKQVAISIKGGSARGTGSIGLIRFLQERDLKPTVVAGSSSGGMVASAYALGLRWERILELLTSIKFYTMLSAQAFLKEKSLISHQKYRNKLIELVPELDEQMKQESLDIPLVLYTTNIYTKQREFLTTGDLITNILASSAYPLIFPEVRIEDKTFIDGDLTSSFSVKYLKEEYEADYVIGIGYDGSEANHDHKEHGFVSHIVDLYGVLMHQVELSHDAKNPPEVEIRYSAIDHGYFDFSSIAELAERAYDECVKQEKEIFSIFSN